MPFSRKDLRIITRGPVTLWNYWTDDTSVKVKTRGYFEEAKELLGVGDWIFATTSTGGVMLHVDEIDPLELGDPR